MGATNKYFDSGSGGQIIVDEAIKSKDINYVASHEAVTGLGSFRGEPIFYVSISVASYIAELVQGHRGES